MMFTSIKSNLKYNSSNGIFTIKLISTYLDWSIQSKLLNIVFSSFVRSKTGRRSWPENALYYTAHHNLLLQQRLICTFTILADGITN